MLIELKEQIEEVDFEIGDIIVTETNYMLLIIMDIDEKEFVVVDIINNIEVFKCSDKGALTQILEGTYSRIAKVINADNLKLIEI